jgi:hypothetical protein
MLAAALTSTLGTNCPARKATKASIENILKITRLLTKFFNLVMVPLGFFLK